jgi:hypothetical protein|tara:strand:- start:175 stop:330 length:156 start_codon:yes stop_codon:yes gene_type:complete
MSHGDHQKWRLKMLNVWKDRLEERLAGVDASISKLQEQIERDTEPEVETEE